MHIHLGIKEKLNVQSALVCGSPERAEMLSGLLDSPKVLAKNREYHSYGGKFNGKDLLIVSHGVGSAGAAICFNELAMIGVKNVIRLGTAGGLADDTDIGDCVVATSAVRMDGVSVQMLPVEFPAFPDAKLALNLEAAITKNAQTESIRVKSGVVLTSDLFYPGPLDNKLAFYRDAGVVAVEMEISTLFIVGYLRGMKTAAVVVLDGNPLKWKDGVYDPRPERLKKSTLVAAKSVLETLSQY